MRAMKFGVGQPVKRVEDVRLVSGQGAYASDYAPEDALHAAFLRSPHAHATFAVTDIQAARAVPGVRGVFVASDFAALGEIPCLAKMPNSDGSMTASRAVLAWRLSNTNDASFCAAALEEALLRFGKPRIFNTDQGSTFTAEAFAGKLAAAGVAISMDGRGRFMDNIFIERLWRSIKYEEVHLKAYADGREARAGIGSWMTFYNFRRPHQAMNNQMPMAVWRAGMDKIEAAARHPPSVSGTAPRPDQGR